MALIVEYHVNADMYAVGATAITQGMLVGFNSSSQIVPTTAATDLSVGIAGDAALAAEAATTAYSANLTVGANGNGTRFTENRVSDFYDETTASQKVTVYNGGGKFHVSDDVFDTAADISGGELLRPSAATAGYWDDGATVANNDEVGLAVSASVAYDSGVPGTDTSSGSISLGDYVAVVLRV